MLYNINKKTIQTNIQCLNCDAFDKKAKTCHGLGKYCFEYDKKTQTIIDPVTKLPIKMENKIWKTQT